MGDPGVPDPPGASRDEIAAQLDEIAVFRLAPALQGDQLVPDEMLAAAQHDREPAIRQVQAQPVRVEQRAAAARDTGRPIAPPPLLKPVTALPNTYGPTPLRLDHGLLHSPTSRTSETEGEESRYGSH